MDATDVSMERVERFRERLLNWAERNLRDFPWRETTNPYEVLVAEVLLGATLASKVVPIYDEFLDRYPTATVLADAEVDSVASLLEPLGLQNRRANAFVAIADQVGESGVPESESELLELQYVGKYAANATLCFAFGQRRPIVDENVVRVFGRAFGLDLTPTEKDAWEFAERILPEVQVRRYNLALLDFGALVCVSGNPNCEVCFYTDECEYFNSVVDL